MARRPHRAPFCLAALLLSGVLGAGVCSAAATSYPKGVELPAGAPEEESFYDTLDVRVVNVEAYVTDRHDRRVTGLTRDDFEIYEDGAPVPITNFWASDPGAPGSGLAVWPDDQELYLAVFIDNRSLTPAARARVVPILERFLQGRASPRELVLLASYDGPGELNLRQGPTRDPAALAAALGEIAAFTPGAQDQYLERRSLELQMRQLSDPSGTGDPCRQGGMPSRKRQAEASAVLASIDSYADRAFKDIQDTYSTLDRFIQALAALPGRKAVLFVGGEATLHPGEELYTVWRDRFSCAGGDSAADSHLRAVARDAGTLLTQLGARADGNRVGFYSLAVPTLSRLGSETGNFDLPTLNQQLDPADDLEHSLFRMSVHNGGTAQREGTDPALLLARMGEDFDAYYSLGYRPAYRRTGQDHEIRVTVKRPGLRVRHRQVVRDRDSPEILRDRTFAALLFGPRDNPLKVGLEFDHETALGEHGEREVTVAVKLPISNLVLLPRGDFHEGRLTIQLVTRDAEGHSSGVQQFEVPVRVPNKQFLTALGWVAGYRAKLVLPPTAHTVAVGVRDELSHAISTVTGVYPPERWAAEAAAARAPALTLAAGPPTATNEGKP